MKRSAIKRRRHAPAPGDVLALMMHFGPSPTCARVGCTERATDFHHIKPKARGGSDAITNRMPLCRKDHDWAHTHSEAAHEEGLMLWSWEDERAS